MKIFDVTDLSNPVAVMAPDLSGMEYSEIYRVNDSDYDIACECYCLNNGGILVAADGRLARTYLIYPERQVVQEIDECFDQDYNNYNIVVRNQVFFMDPLYESMEVSSFSSLRKTHKFSVEGGVPDHQYVCGGPDGMYFWEAGAGLYYIDEEGWRREAAAADKIEYVDFISLPYNILDMRVNQNGSCALYDNTTKSIRLLIER